LSEYFVYMLTNRWKNVLYTGMTDGLDGRLSDHKHGRFDGFTRKYNCNRLVYFERHSDVASAAAREQQIKGWTRVRKDALIATINPEWNDLSNTWQTLEGGDPSLRSG
jgi:putative endonuclease